MKRVKVMFIGTGTPLDPYRVQLPTYVRDCQRDAEGRPVLDPHGEPLDDVDWENLTCYVLVPDDEVSEDGTVNTERIRAKYPQAWKKFDPLLVAPMDVARFLVTPERRPWWRRLLHL